MFSLFNFIAKNLYILVMNSIDDDYEIRRTIWESRIPVEFILDSSQPILRSQQSTFVCLDNPE